MSLQFVCDECGEPIEMIRFNLGKEDLHVRCFLLRITDEDLQPTVSFISEFDSLAQKEIEP